LHIPEEVPDYQAGLDLLQIKEEKGEKRKEKIQRGQDIEN